MAKATLPAREAAATLQEQRLLLRAVDWHTYLKIADALTGRHVRLTYDRGTLEFMTISSLHAHCARLIGRLVVILTEELGLPLRSFGDMTCNREDLERGLEPDECYYIRSEPRIREKEQIDLTEDPPPDLAVEVDISRSSRSRLPIYAALSVPEVWQFDGELLVIHLRQDDGGYATADRSGCFPQICGADLARFLQLRKQLDDNSLVRSFREWVREQLRASS